MTLHEAPHRPNKSELKLAERMNLPKEESYREFVLHAAGKKFEAREYVTAAKMLKALILQWPDDVRFYEAFAALYQAQGKLVEARACFEAAYALDDTRLRPNLNLGEMKFRIDKDKAGAKKHLERVVQFDPDGPYAARAKLTLKRVA